MNKKFEEVILELPEVNLNEEKGRYGFGYGGWDLDNRMRGGGASTMAFYNQGYGGGGPSGDPRNAQDFAEEVFNTLATKIFGAGASMLFDSWTLHAPSGGFSMPADNFNWNQYAWANQFDRWAQQEFEQNGPTRSASYWSDMADRFRSGNN